MKYVGLSALTGNDHRLTPMLHNLTHVHAFAGLSESGKSTFAQKLCDHFSPGLAFRSKIAHFNDEASETMQRSIYELSEKEQAISLIHGIKRFFMPSLPAQNHHD